MTKLYSLLFILALPLASFGQGMERLAGSSGAPEGRGREHPEVVKAFASMMKDHPMPMALTWDANIAKLGNNVDGWTVTSFASEGDDLYIGGDFRSFDTVAAENIVHYNRRTKVWDALDVGVHNVVRAIAVHNGKVYVGGDFRSVGSGYNVVNSIAMWDGSTWSGLDVGMDGSVTSLAFIGDTLYAGGYFQQAGSVAAHFLATWDGNAWSEATRGTSYPVQTLLATHDSLFVGGDFRGVGGQDKAAPVANCIAMLRRGVWSEFGTGLSSIRTMALYRGKLYAAGDFYTAAGGQFFYSLASWDGSIWNPEGHDTILGTNRTGGVLHLLTVGDTLLAMGQFSSMAGVEAKGIAMLENGKWSEFGGGVYGYSTSAISFDGRLLFGGRFTKAGSQPIEALAAWSNSNWSAVAQTHSSYLGWETDDIRAIATNDRYVFIGGNFTSVAGQTCNHVAAWDKSLKRWTTLGSGVDGDVYALRVAGGKLIVGGSFNWTGNISAHHIASYDLATNVWSSMGSGSSRTLVAIASKGTDVYASVFDVLEPTGWADHIGKWDGSSWTDVGDGLTNGFIESLIFHDTSLYAAGNFNVTASGNVVNGVAQLQDGQWIGLNSGLSHPAYAMASSGGNLFVGGEFVNADNVLSPGVAMWDGTSWNAVGDRINAGVYALTADGKGGVYIGGRFDSVAGINRGYMVHWNGSSFSSVSGGVDNTVVTLATDNAALYAGGWMESAGTSRVESLHLAALKGAGAQVAASASTSQSFLSVSENTSNQFKIEIKLPEPETVRVEVLNVIGEAVTILAVPSSLVESESIGFDGSKLPGGLYFVRLSAGKYSALAKILLDR